MTRPLVALLCVLVLACSVATPRSGVQPVEAPVPSPRQVAPVTAGLLSGAPQAQPLVIRDRTGAGTGTAARRLTAGAPLAVTYSGIVNYAEPQHGRYYLAIPDGRGVRVRICGPAGCLDRTSTDAGPALHMQRAGRIADLNSVDWERISGVSLRYGGFQGTILILERPARIVLPQTSTEEGP